MSHSSRTSCPSGYPYRVAAHPVLENLPALLEQSGAWRRWRDLDDRLSRFESLDDLNQMELHHRDRYAAVAALVGIASRRNHDDDDAALAVVAVLAPGVGALAHRLRDRCEVDDVIVAVWERAKAAEPQPGPRAADFLLRRAHARLVVETAFLAADRDVASIDGLDFDVREIAVEDETCFDRPVTDLVDLLAWAQREHVVPAADMSVLVELVDLERSGVRRKERNQIVAARIGRTPRSVFRCEDRAIALLRAAVAATDDHPLGGAA